MALANFTLAAVEPATPVLVAATPAPLHVDLGLLYSPEDHQPNTPQQHNNEPFIPPANQRRPKVRKRAGGTYLPPQNQYTRYPQVDVPYNPYDLHTQVHPQIGRLDIQVGNQRDQDVNTQYDNTGQYIHDPTGDYDYEQRKMNQNAGYRPGYADNPYSPATPPPPSSPPFQNQNQNINNFKYLNRPAMQEPPRIDEGGVNSASGQLPPDRPRGFTKVESAGSGGKTQLHAVLDYDESDEYDDIPGGKSPVTSSFTFSIFKFETRLPAPHMLLQLTVPQKLFITDVQSTFPHKKTKQSLRLVRSKVVNNN